VFAFTATSSVPYERLVNNCIARPTVLKFKSEYEMVKGVSPVTDAAIVQVLDAAGVLAALGADVAKFYDKKPIIIIRHEDQEESIIKLLKAEQYKYALGADRAVLADIRQWDYGVLILSPEQGRGVDARFRRDALVLVTTPVTTYHELQQMIGRSSRSRGICEGTLYSSGAERPAQVVQRMKQHSVTVLQDLERLLTLVEKRPKD
jgi:hypothetical protein